MTPETRFFQAARTWIRGLAVLAAAGLLAVALAACGRREAIISQAPLGTPAAPATQPPAASAGDPCAQRFQAIRDLYRTIPETFRNLKEPIEKVVERVERCRDQLEKFRSECAAYPGAPESGFMLARLLINLSTRLRLTLPPETAEARMKEYYGRVIALAQDSLAWAGEKDPLRPQCLDLIGDAHLYNQDFEPALQHYQQVLEKHPEYLDYSTTILAAGQAYLDLRRTGEGIAFIRKAIHERRLDPIWPGLHEVLWKLLEAAGDLEGMERHCLEVQHLFPLRLMREGIGKAEEEDCRRYLGYSGFRLGYTLIAKGDAGAARAAFSKHIEELARREAELKGQNKALPQELQIFRDRSRTILGVLENQFGKPYEKDLDSLLWATSSRVLLSSGSGKAVAIVFRGLGDARSAGFLQALDQHGAARGGKLALAAVSWLKDAGDPHVHLQAAREEAARLGLRFAALGLDPDFREKSLIRSFQIMALSATFLIFDPQGNLAWYQQDPREVNSRLAIRIWDRIAGS
ncbi:MAG: hypothetical protein HY717_11470 [Planctomycetes bacterium]|nr:hypothetical protein [Planctomycetota bacterium]